MNKLIALLQTVCVSFLIFLLTSCNNSSNIKTKEKEIELQNEETELMKREIANKDKVQAQQRSVDQSTNSTIVQDKNPVFYIINVAAVKTESEARTKAQELENNGHNSGYLWIPDYASLSGAKFYSVYVGKYSTQYDCEVATEKYRKIHPEAYGLLVSQDNKRVQINGIGKVTVSEGPKQGSNTTVIHNSDYSDLKLFWEYFKGNTASKDYNKLTEQTYFPFLNHGTYLYKSDFERFTFPEYIIKGIKKAKPPVKSAMMFGSGTDTNGNSVTVDFNYKTKCDLYEVDLGGPAIYFSKVNGYYKFIAILYGD